MFPSSKKIADCREATTTSAISPPATVQLAPPEVYRLPRSGERDPYHGLTRSFYYEAEKVGQLKLIRLRKRGNARGVTLVPFRAVAELIRKAAQEMPPPESVEETHISGTSEAPQLPLCTQPKSKPNN
jgi:hypothetical protein